MRIDIEHNTRLSYSSQIFCEPLTVRLRPRQDGSQQIHHFELHVEPCPAGQAELVDAEGNAITSLWFGGLTDHLSITTRCTVETFRSNPFDFLLTDAAMSLPIRLSDDERQILEPYTIPESRSESVAEFARQLLDAAGPQPVVWLVRLAALIRECCPVIHREQGPPWPAERTLRERRGACRDLAVLFNDVCRFVGFPARFVSGYQIDVPEESRPELHAWSEVYLPGAGWRGFDPSQGLAVADRHVPLAASRTPWMASPTSGTYRGTARSTLTANVQFRSPEWAASA